jgi:hypothetical protein
MEHLRNSMSDDDYEKACRLLRGEEEGEDDEEDTPPQDRDWREEERVEGGSERHGERSRVSDIPEDNGPPEFAGMPRRGGRLTGDGCVHGFAEGARIGFLGYTPSQEASMKRAYKQRRTQKQIALDAKSATAEHRATAVGAAGFLARFPDARRIKRDPGGLSW